MRRLPASVRAARRLLLNGSTAPPPSWTPNDLPNLTLWWDASTVGASDGAALADWTDRKSGLSAAQAIGTVQPLFKENRADQNDAQGKPSVWFDGTDDALVTGAALTLGQPFTAFVVARLATSAGHRNIWAASNTVFARSQAGNPLLFSGAGLEDTAHPIAPGAWFCLVGVFAGATSSLRYCGASTSGSAGTGGIGPSAALALGGAYPSDGGLTWSGDIAQVAFCTGAVSASQITQFEAWAATRYGVTLL